MRPFVGMTGRHLDAMLVDARLPRERLFVVNATCCQPPPNKTERMMREAVDCCRPVLAAQVCRFADDTPVLAMGKWAAYGLLGVDRGVMNARGFIRQFKLSKVRELIR